MKKQVEILILPTNQKSVLIRTNRNKIVLSRSIINIEDKQAKNQYAWIYQHLYIISDDKITNDSLVVVNNTFIGIVTDISSGCYKFNPVTDKEEHICYYTIKNINTSKVYRIDDAISTINKIVATTDEHLIRFAAMRDIVMPMPSTEFLSAYTHNNNMKYATILLAKGGVRINADNVVSLFPYK